MKTKILILASNPKSDLKLDREIRNLIEVIKRSPDRDRFIIETRLAVRPQDLQAALLEEKPRIVHFCGHGSGERGLVLENDLGELHFVRTEALADLFSHFSHQIECVLLNACYSQVQAKEIVKHINFVVGMRQPILDSSAIAFSAGFYGALGAGESITKAYNFGCNRIHLEFGDSSSSRKLVAVPEKSDSVVPKHLIPELLKNEKPTEIEQADELLELLTMEPISLIIEALVTGAAKAAGDTAPDVYNGLKALIKRKFAGEPKAEMVLAEYEQDSETYEAPLKKKLKEAGADKDEEIIKAARDLLARLQDKPDGQQIVNQTQTNTASGNTVSGNFDFSPVQEGIKKP